MKGVAEDWVLCTRREVASFVLTVDVEVKFVLPTEFLCTCRRIPKDGPFVTSWTAASLTDDIAVRCVFVLLAEKVAARLGRITKGRKLVASLSMCAMPQPPSPSGDTCHVLHGSSCLSRMLLTPGGALAAIDGTHRPVKAETRHRLARPVSPRTAAAAAPAPSEPSTEGRHNKESRGSLMLPCMGLGRLWHAREH